MALIGLLALWLRHRYFGFESLGNYALSAALALQFIGYQRMMSQPQPRGLRLGIEVSQWGWFGLALSLPGLGPALGALGFLVLQLTVKAPLKHLLREEPARHPWLLLFGFLALVGCLPFASFIAYFQSFIPLMSVADSVSTMQQKLFSGFGLWAAIVLLSVVYQSCALGYFYWSQVMLAPAPDGAKAWSKAAWLLLAGLLTSLGLGLCRGLYGGLLQGMLSFLNIAVPT